VKKSIQDDTFKIRDGCKPQGDRDFHSLNLQYAIFRPILSQTLSRVDAAILGLADDQHPPGSKKLKGTEDLYRIRVGDYRVIYTIESKRLVVLVVNVGNRRDIYRSL
jgi:mRNA interferase RelE/StbE